MSSKSKKKQPRNPDKGQGGAHPTAGVAAGAPGHDDDVKKLFARDEDIIEVPRGVNRVQFIVLIVLLILMLVTLGIGFTAQSAFTGGGGDQGDVFLSWDGPDGKRIELRDVEYYSHKERLSKLRNNSSITDEDVAQRLIVEELARAAGIVIPDSRVREQVGVFAEQMGGADQYKAALRRFPGGVTGFEQAIRDDLLASSYVTVLSSMASQPDADEIRELWAKDHEEFAFDFVQIEIETIKDDARAELPADEELSAWFDELAEGQKADLYTPERYAADVIHYTFGEEPPAALLAEYPEPEDADPEERARTYYDAVRFYRFVEIPDEDEDEDEDALPKPKVYIEFEDGKDDALAEAPVYFALQQWRDDVSERIDAGEELDVLAEAADLGLSVDNQTDPLSREDWVARETVGGDHLATMIRVTTEGMARSVSSSPSALTLAVVGERLERFLPPFEEIKDGVADKWVDERAPELAVERLRALADGMAPAEEAAEDEPEEDVEDVEDAAGEDEVAEAEEETVAPFSPFEIDRDAFLAAATAAGYEPGRRDWLDRAAGVNADPDSEKPAHIFLRGQPDYYTLEPGTVGEPRSDFRGEYAYLVRLEGKREAPISSMTPQQYQQLVGQATRTVSTAFYEKSLSFEALQPRYDVYLRRFEEFEEEELPVE